MSSNIKKLIQATVLALLISVGLSAPAYATSDQTVITAAQNAVEYLSANQNTDGSVSGYGGTTDWAVMAVAASGNDPASFTNGGSSATDFIKTETPGPTTPATDVERKIIAIADAGQDPTSFGGTDYISTLNSYHNNGQIGDTTLLNDDIFGVIAAGASKDASLTATAQDGLDYFISYQGADGGFSYTTNSCIWCGSDSNDTAAAIIAMQAANSLGLSNVNLGSSQTNALAYLLSTQQADGGFGYDIYSPSDGSSTAWGLMALNTLGDPVKSQALLARDWLLANQNSDGGFGFVAYGTTGSDTFTTSHAILALLGTTWALDPEPLHAAAPVTPVTPVTQVSTDPKPATEVKQGETPTPGSTEPKTKAVVLGAQTSNNQNPPTLKQLALAGITKDSTVQTHKASLNYRYYPILALSVIALIWYVLQSKLNRGEI